MALLTHLQLSDVLSDMLSDMGSVYILIVMTSPVYNIPGAVSCPKGGRSIQLRGAACRLPSLSISHSLSYSTVSIV